MAVPTGGEAADQQAPKIGTNTNLAVLEGNVLGPVQAQHQETGGLDKADTGKVRDNNGSLLPDKPSEGNLNETSTYQSQFRGKFAAAMRAPWNMDAVKAARLSKAQWLQAHEAILLECGFLVCLDGHADEPRDAYHPITPKEGLRTAPPEFYQVQELHDYLTKQSMPLAVRKLCQWASPTLYAATYPVDVLGLPTQLSLPDVDDIDNPEVIIHLQVPFVALALVLQQHIKITHDELSFKLHPIQGLPNTKLRRGPRGPKKTKPIEEQTTVKSLTEGAEGTQMRGDPTGEFVVSKTWDSDLEQARKSISIKELLERRKTGITYRKIAKRLLVSMRDKAAISVGQSQLDGDQTGGRKRADLYSMAKQLVALWLQDIGDFSRKERQLRKAEKAAHNKLLAASALNCKEDRILRRLGKAQDWFERSGGPHDLGNRLENAKEMRQTTHTGDGKVAELDQELSTLKDLQAKWENKHWEASQNVEDSQAELSKSIKLKVCALQKSEGYPNGDSDRNTLEPKPNASNPLVAREVLKRKFYTQLNQRKAEDTRIKSAAAHDRLSPHKRVKYGVSPRDPEEKPFITGQPGVFHDRQLLQHDDPIPTLTPLVSHGQPPDYPPASAPRSIPEVLSWNHVEGLVERRQTRPDHNTLQQHPQQETRLAVPQAQVYRPQSSPRSFQPYTVPVWYPPANMEGSFHVQTPPGSSASSQPQGSLQHHLWQQRPEHQRE
ncbi:uncharacterized protein PgNI_04414 [Pyricularia grisea]|uniref:Uncharacterized protein n=1 Tax=Pyricularia grisea TaxID=148305 RepID=A0A6P8BEU5_PYRGI|nr:uncharacterized protein PgNI_04414 [Pyricularia grisea]TLD14264.1 hypothetical protein PgNI_04414 [Pyricularia grisea]